MILATPNKSCELDPIPTNLLKHILPCILKLITDIVNLSLDDGMFPDTLKEALVKPLLKKANLDLINNNFRPVSNLAYISKLAKSAAASQLIQHIDRFHLMKSNQLAYRALHSTETALLKVKTDISALDHQEVTCLILLDLSAAFDTIGHFTLLQQLQQCFAVSCTSLEWFCSYFTNRTQAVVIQNILSDSCKSASMPLGDICHRNRIEFHLDVDDPQIYMTFKPSIPMAKEECITKVEKSISDIDIWMSQNLLKLNGDKTEFIMFGTRKQLAKVGDIHLKISPDKVVPVDHVKNLGYIMDKFLKNRLHINKLTSTCYCMLHDIAKVRSSMDKRTAQLIMQALVLSHMDYCNSLLAGITQYQLDKLQHIQNMGCQVICNLKKNDHVTPSMKGLHWLKIHDRILYKLCLLVYKCHNVMSPEYLADMLPSKTHLRTLRSSTNNTIPPAHFKNSQCHRSSFSSAGPMAWNSLLFAVKTSHPIDNFKSSLKHTFTTFHTISDIGLPYFNCKAL